MGLGDNPVLRVDLSWCGAVLRKSIAKPRGLGEDAQMGQKGRETEPPVLQLRQQRPWRQGSGDVDAFGYLKRFCWKLCAGLKLGTLQLE